MNDLRRISHYSQSEEEVVINFPIKHRCCIQRLGFGEPTLDVVAQKRQPRKVPTLFAGNKLTTAAVATMQGNV